MDEDLVMVQKALDAGDIKTAKEKMNIAEKKELSVPDQINRLALKKCLSDKIDDVTHNYGHSREDSIVPHYWIQRDIEQKSSLRGTINDLLGWFFS